MYANEKENKRLSGAANLNLSHWLRYEMKEFINNTNIKNRLDIIESNVLDIQNDIVNINSEILDLQNEKKSYNTTQAVVAVAESKTTSVLIGGVAEELKLVSGITVHITVIGI